jgi:hypothetical protein
LFDVSWLKIGEKIMDSILYDTDWCHWLLRCHMTFPLLLPWS